MQEGSRVMGIVVDAVSDVYTLSRDDMRSAPDLGSSIDTDFIQGLVTVDEKMVILLDIDKLLTTDELPSLAELKSALSA